METFFRFLEHLLSYHEESKREWKHFWPTILSVVIKMLNKLIEPNSIRNKKLRLFYSIVLIVFSSLLQTFVIQTFMNPCNLLSSGFTGLALLINKISLAVGMDIPTSVSILALNIPCALFCAKRISKRFTFLSCIQFTCTSFFLTLFDFQPIFHDLLLNIIFGGFLYGMVTVIALRTDGSTGGTDFIALYISDILHKSIWNYVFIFNMCLIVIFGAMFGWQYAGYSILFQLISTKTIDNFYNRYAQVMIEITTQDPDKITKVFSENFRHGMSVVKAYGAYSHQTYYLCRSIISTYEENEAIRKLRETDPKAIVYSHRIENFYGSFYRRPIE